MSTPSCWKLCIRSEAAARSGARRHGGKALPLAGEPRAAAIAIALGGAFGRALDGGEEAPHQHHCAEQPGEQRERARGEEERAAPERLEDRAGARALRF